MRPPLEPGRLARCFSLCALAWIGLSGAESQTVGPVEEHADEILKRPDPDAAPANVVAGNIGELTAIVELEPELRGARAVDRPEDWPASFYSTFDRGRPCTSAMIGYRIILTAAHCIQRGGRLTFKVGGRTHHATCTRHPRYGRNDIPSADYALCLVPLPAPTLPYERLNKEPSLLTIPGKLHLSGFGCVNPDGTGGHDNVYRMGEADIKALPSGSGPNMAQSRNSIRTEGEAAVCFGDSGGPAFRMGAGGARVIVSVNSVTRERPDGTLMNISYLSSTSTPDALDFYSKWKAKVRELEPSFDPKICGLDDDAGGCR